MVIVETPVFSRQVRDLLSDDTYRQLQAHLVRRPQVGKLIPHGGGLRKVRWTAEGQGKRGGVRAIYYWVVQRDLIVMLLIYAKSSRQDLTPKQLAQLRGLVESEFP